MFLPEKLRYTVGLAVDQPRLYRYFDNEKYAADFCKGQLRLSTLKTCKEIENLARRDSDEGTSTYLGGFALGHGTDESLVELASRQGVSVGQDVRFGVVANNVVKTLIPDAHLLCMTARQDAQEMEGYGPYCVEIFSPMAFFSRLTRTLLLMGHSFEAAALGCISYRERTYTGLEREPGPLGFVKPPDKYAKDQEYRFLWAVEKPQSRLERIGLSYSPLGALCRRLS